MRCLILDVEAEGGELGQAVADLVAFMTRPKGVTWSPPPTVKSGQTGGSISGPPAGVSTGAGGVNPLEPPVSNKSGG